MKKSGGGGARDKSPPPRIDSPVKEREEEEIKNMKNVSQHMGRLKIICYGYQKLGLQDDSQI